MNLWKGLTIVTGAIFSVLLAGCAPGTTTQIEIVEMASPTIPPEGQVGDTWLRPADGMTMVYVPGGEFVMGSTDEEVDEAIHICADSGSECNRHDFEDEQPAHPVRVTGFWIDRNEVSNTQYQQCVNAGVCQVPMCKSGTPTYDDPTSEGYPIVCASLEEAKTYCGWAGGRLPTEAEWEYAARGPQGWIFPWGNEFDPLKANSQEIEDGFNYLAPVESYSAGASWVGAVNMAGNAWEWTEVWIGDYAGGSSGLFTGALRGGSWAHTAVDLRTAARVNFAADIQIDRIGFRCAGISEINLTPTLSCWMNPSGVLELDNGSQLQVSSVSFSPDYPPAREFDAAPQGYIILDAKTYQYWIRTDWLVEYGLTRHADNLELNCATSAPCPAGQPRFSIDYATTAGEAIIQLEQVVGYTPDCIPRHPANELSAETLTDALEVTWVDLHGTTHTFVAASVRLWEYDYPAPGISYIVYGDGWREYEMLRVLSPGVDEPMEHPLNQLTNVEFPGGYNELRAMALTLMNGDPLNVTLVPQGDAAEWQADGLIFDLYAQTNRGYGDVRSRGILLYIPFAAAQAIRWEARR